ncbi:MAG: protein-glutamate methylesterase/protein-glutamine glutaminase [Bryobacteraceae bacterium]
MARFIYKKTLPAGNRIRVLVVDDSVVIRRLVTQALSGDPALEVVGSASNGALALARIAQTNPDIVTLDVEMPEMNGLEMLRRLSKENVRPRVVMFSTLTERGATATLDALALGADDYVMKAANGGSLERSLNGLREELIPKLKQFFVLPAQPPAEPPQQPAPAPATGPTTRRPGGNCAKVLAIGVSTGGPTALGIIIPQVPPDFPLPILIVQHMPPLFTRLLAERLQASTRLKVEEAAEGSTVTAGKVLIAPGGYHMRLRNTGKDTVIGLDQSPPENSCRPAVDVLFRSVGETFGGSAIGAILTGMGQDGLRGVQTLKAAGAFVIAQDEASSVVWGMPGSVVAAGLADSVVPLERVIPEVLRRI